MFDCIPKKFLCWFPLTIGGLLYGALMIVANLVCLIMTIIVIIDFGDCGSNCKNFVANNVYGYNTVAAVYFVLMILVNLCYIWAVWQKKPALVIGWIASNALWLIIIVCFTLLLLILYYKQTTFLIFCVCVVFGIIGVCIVVYGLLIALGLWREMVHGEIAGESA